MPPKPRKRASEVADYESDGGFVADDNDNDDKPKAKRAKTTKSSASATNTGGSRKDARAVHDKEVVGGGAVDANGDEYFELSHLRRVTISSFKGKRMVSIREYYEKDGEALPGKKGISMPLEQYSTLVTLLPHIETVLREKGEKVPRPDYEGQGRDAGGDDADGGGGGSEVEEEEVEQKGSRGGDGNGVEKNNFEATSEEEEEEDG
ncbi:hypothetical protein MMC16_007122 [Acarospora aff. strigata]|nr:hypothetical protein [Acarospora aff. strigata]